MTDGERMVWAVVFGQAAKEGLRNPPAGVTADRERWVMWEAQQVDAAVEQAGCMIEHLREAKERIADGFGPANKIYHRLCEILDGQNRG